MTRETFFVALRTGHSIHEMLGGLSRGVCGGSARASFFSAISESGLTTYPPPTHPRHAHFQIPHALLINIPSLSPFPLPLPIPIYLLSLSLSLSLSISFPSPSPYPFLSPFPLPLPIPIYLLSLSLSLSFSISFPSPSLSFSLSPYLPFSLSPYLPFSLAHKHITGWSSRTIRRDIVSPTLGSVHQCRRQLHRHGRHLPAWLE